jgi:cell wall-associated NlpC family hydrolase
MNALGRGGVVIAMSSGLVATMGLPAQAVSNASGPEAAAAPAAAPASAAPAGAAFTSASLTAAPSFQAGAPLTAPAAATVDFESGVFTAVPKPKVTPSRSSDSDSGSSTSTKSYKSAGFGSARGSAVLSVAARYYGVAYRYGGTGPSGGWDCSGAVKYIFGQLGISLPRTANAQMLATTRVSRSNAKAGDLVFFLSGGHAYHVGIYAGGNMMVDSGRTGKTFSKREIWSSSVVFGRV